tara:strand:- start:516 stop:674 length:159 start_codon:yes stop_codon:yes gene_type:complete
MPGWTKIDEKLFMFGILASSVFIVLGFLTGFIFLKVIGGIICFAVMYGKYFK